MNKYGQYCPMARALEILGDRWTLLIVRDLLAGPLHFNALERGLPGISRTLLAQRLRLLQQAGLLERQPGMCGGIVIYALTPAGQDLLPVVDALVERERNGPLVNHAPRNWTRSSCCGGCAAASTRNACRRIAS